jgi:glycosyltransferase involved in cell wall biosynthesis
MEIFLVPDDHDKIRILHLRASRFHGGPEKQILHHAISASSRDQEIWLGSFRDGPGSPEFLERAERVGLPTIEFSSGRFRPQTILELVRSLKKNKFSLLCTHGYKANLLGWVASRLTGCPQIAFARGWTGENWRIKAYEQLERLVLRWTDWVVCVSRPLAEEIGKERMRKTPPQIVPNCALFRFQNLVLPVDRLPLRQALRLDPDRFCVCAAGRLSPEKGHRYLLRAVPNLIDRIPGLLIILLGEGRERAELERLATDLGIRKHILFAGFKKNIRPWIQASDVLVNPSLTEGMPNVVLEAMALGTPVIATSVGGVPDLVEHLHSGVLVAPGDSNLLGVAIHSVFANHAERLGLAHNAQKRLFEYSPERQTQRLNELYAQALGVSERPRVRSSIALPIQG